MDEALVLTAAAARVASTPPMSRWLRGQTRSEHLDVETQVGLDGLESRDQLIGLLHGWAEIWRAVQAAARSIAACPVAAEELLIPAAQSLDWLTRDLLDLDAEPRQQGNRDAARQLHVTALLGLPAPSWGVAYVLRGSRLGGAVLAPQIRERLLLPPDRCTRFLASSGTDSLRDWSAFRRRLDEAALTGSARVDAAEAARWTFGWVGATIAGRSQPTATLAP